MAGLTSASLKAAENVPVEREELMMWVRAETTYGEIACSRWVGMGSTGQVVGWLEAMSKCQEFVFRRREKLTAEGDSFLHHERSKMIRY